MQDGFYIFNPNYQKQQIVHKNNKKNFTTKSNNQNKKQHLNISLKNNNFDNNYVEKLNSLYVQKIPNRTQSIEKLNEPIDLKILKSITDEEKARDIHGVLFGGNHSLNERYQMLMNGLQSKFGIGGGTQTSQMKNTNPKKVKYEVPDTTVIDPQLALESRYGDTIRVDKNFYMIPESINLNNIRLGSRNKGSREPFNTKGGLIPTYRPILPYEQGKWFDKDSEGNINHFLGYDNKGKIKVGPLNLFGPGDTMTQVFYSQLLNIPKNNGDYLYGPGSKNPKNRKSPLVDVRYENGKSSRNGLLIKTGHKRSNFNPNAMEMAGGGAYIVKVDNELRLIRGSVNNVMQELELIKNNHKNKPIYLYEVDNGSYNRGLRPYDNNYSTEELISYDAQNVDSEPGGHFFYIK